jgi:Fe-Mn family superoxide dismutase
MFRTALTRTAVKPWLTRSLIVSSRGKHTLPDLPYDFNALEPVISAQIMELHYTKHHQAYVNNLNLAEEKLEKAIQEKNVNEYIALQSAIKFNGGGHINHSIFWTNLASPKQGGGELTDGELLKAIERDFGSLEKMITKFNTVTAAVQGSGWGWLVSVCRV